MSGMNGWTQPGIHIMSFHITVVSLSVATWPSIDKRTNQMLTPFATSLTFCDPLPPCVMWLLLPVVSALDWGQKPADLPQEVDPEQCSLLRWVSAALPVCVATETFSRKLRIYFTSLCLLNPPEAPSLFKSFHSSVATIFEKAVERNDVTTCAGTISMKIFSQYLE